VILRTIQGFSLGGQWGGAMLLVTETAPKRRRGFYGSFAQAGGGTGAILANLVFLFVTTMLPKDAFLSWAWRVPFIMSIVLVPITAYIQFRLEDTPAFRKLEALRMQSEKERAPDPAIEAFKKRQRWPVFTAIRTYPKEIAFAAGTIVSIQVNFYIVNIFTVAYATDPAGLNISRDLMLSAVLVGGVLLLVGVFISGAASDMYGRRNVMLTGATLLGIWTFIFFPLIQTRSLLWIMVATGMAQLCCGLVSGAQAAFAAELFGTEVRYSGASLAIQGGSIFGGGIAPVVATALYAQFRTTFAVTIYLACTCLITIAAAAFAAETHKRDLDAI